MRSRWHIVAVVLLTVGCDPLFSLRVQQALYPTPAPSCLEGALAASPHVSKATRVESGSDVTRYELTLRDTAAEYLRPTLDIARPTSADPAVTVRVTYYWMLTSRLRPAEEAAVAKSGAALLDDLRTACAPGTTSEVHCEYAGFGAGGSCSATNMSRP